MKTEVKHSESKDAWNVVCLDVGQKYKLARCPYYKSDHPEVTKANSDESLKIAKFISNSFNRYW